MLNIFINVKFHFFTIILTENHVDELCLVNMNHFLCICKLIEVMSVYEKK